MYIYRGKLVAITVYELSSININIVAIKPPLLIGSIIYSSYIIIRKGRIRS